MHQAGRGRGGRAIAELTASAIQGTDVLLLTLLALAVGITICVPLGLLVTRFTRFDLAVRLEMPAGTDRDKADKLLHKSEAVCLITASLNTENHLETEIVTA